MRSVGGVSAAAAGMAGMGGGASGGSSGAGVVIEDRAGTGNIAVRRMAAKSVAATQATCGSDRRHAIASLGRVSMMRGRSIRVPQSAAGHRRGGRGLGCRLVLG